MRQGSHMPVLLWTITCVMIHASIVFASESFEDIRFMTEYYPPFSYSDKGEIKGIFPDILMEIGKNMNSPFSRDRISLLPWARGYNFILKNKKSCLFGMVKSEEREPLFKWAGPVMDFKNNLIAKTSRNIHLNTLEDIGNLKIGVVKDDITEKVLLASGIAAGNLVYAFGEEAAKELCLQLNKGLIDLWACDEITARWLLKKNALDPHHFTSVYILQHTDGYFAFSKDVSNDFIKAFQAELDNIKKKPVYQQILHTYLSEELSGF